jgi:molybdopterin converting factor small subunit
VEEAIDRLDRAYAGIKGRLCEDDGTVRRFLNVYVNEEDIRFLQGLATPLKAGDEISIVPAMAGGR